jgi:integrase
VSQLHRSGHPVWAARLLHRATVAGIPPKVVSERLSHATVSITLDTYSHAIPAIQEEEAVLMAGLVFAGE